MNEGNEEEKLEQTQAVGDIEEKENPWPEKNLDFKKCPNCGSERRVCEEVLKSEHAKGKLTSTNRTFIMRSQSLLAANPNFLVAPAVFGFYDACADCGTVYMVHAQCKQITSNIDMNKIASRIDITKGKN